MDRTELRRSIGLVARQAAGELAELAEGEGLTGNVKTAKDLCSVLKDAVALERELRESEEAGTLTVRFEGAAEDAGV